MAWFAVGGAGEGAVWGTVCAAGGIDGWELAGMRVTAFFFFRFAAGKLAAGGLKGRKSRQELGLLVWLKGSKPRQELVGTGPWAWRG